MPCGHNVKMKCSSSIHDQICNEHILLTKVSCLHIFRVSCSNIRKFFSDPCSIEVTKKLPCGHEQQAPCFAPPESIFCPANVSFKLPCSHQATIACGLPVFQRFGVLCNVPKQLSCGHHKLMECHENPSEVDCGLRIEHTLNCGHLHEYICTGTSVEGIDFLCEEIIERRLPCGHLYQLQCGSKTKPLDEIFCRYLN